MDYIVKYFEGRDGVKWYRCTICGYVIRGFAKECPLCQGKGRIKFDEERSDNSDSERNG